MFNRAVRSALLVLCALTALAQVPERVVGSVSAIALEKAALDVKVQDGTTVTIHLTSDTILQRVAPGERSLKNASTIQPTDISVGDKVLVNSDPASGMARRLVVMSATDIKKHDDADAAAWNTHGLSGIVAAISGNDVTLRKRTMQGDTQLHVLVSDKTTYRKYAADSVRFNDAKPSSLADVQVGDQLRARGDKSEDGLKVIADAVVFGSFVTKAGTITAIDPEHRSLAIKELNTNQAFNVKLTADSQLKQMPNFAAMSANGGGSPAGGAVGGGQPPMMGGSGGPNSGHPPDMAQMIERMPAVGMDALKPGDTIVMSSTKGAVPNEYTAIVVLDNAETLIRMANMQRGGGRPGAGAGAAGTSGPQQAGGMQGMGAGGLGNLELPGIMQ